MIHDRRLTHQPPRPPLRPIIGAALLSLAALAGCAPSPTPTPTLTPTFASDEEAFAAAEEVYREYNDAGNARNAGLTEPDPQDFLVGSALQADIDAQRRYAGEGLSTMGEVALSSFAGEDFNVDQVVGTVCLDVAQVRLVDSSGIDVTPTSRPSQVAQQVTIISTSAGMKISNEQSADASSC